MSLGSFIAGAAMMMAGFLMVRKTDVFLRYFGDLSELFGIVNAQWMSWKVFGIFLIIIGFLMATGLLQAVLYLTIGRLFFFGGPSF